MPKNDNQCHLWGVEFEILGVRLASKPISADSLKTRLLTMIYRSKHSKIDLEAASLNMDTYEVMLPYSHFQALLYYISSRVLGTAGMGQQEGVSSAGYWKRYIAECEQLTHSGVNLSHDAGFDKLRGRGFA